MLVNFPGMKAAERFATIVSFGLSGLLEDTLLESQNT